jgi:hypothetical protein
MRHTIFPLNTRKNDNTDWLNFFAAVIIIWLTYNIVQLNKFNIYNTSRTAALNERNSEILNSINELLKKQELKGEILNART